MGFLERRGWQLALVIALVALLLRLPGAFEFWVNPDEGGFYSIVVRHGSDVLEELSANTHPPLFHLMLKAVALFSLDVGVLRLLSVFAGTAAVFGLYLVGRESGGALCGLIAAGLLTVSPTAVESSQLLRPYMLQLAWLAFGAWCYTRYLRTRSSRALAGYAALSVAAVLTHYSSFLVVAAQWGVLLPVLVRGQLLRTELRRLSLAAMPIALACLLGFVLHVRPHLIGETPQLEAQASWLKPFMIHGPGDEWKLLLGVFRYGFGQLAEPLVFLAFVGGTTLGVRRGDVALYGVPLLLIALGITAAALQQYPMGCTRHSLFLLVFVIPPAALALSANLKRGGARAVVTVVVCGLLLALSQPASKLLSAGKDSGQPLPEQLTLRSDVEPLFDHVSDGELVVMDKGTFYCLFPAYWEQAVTPAWSPDRRYLHFRWGSRDVIVRWSWSLILRESDQPELMEGALQPFLEQADRELPDLKIAQRRQAWLVFAGWETRLARDLWLLDSLLPPGKKRVRSDSLYEVDHLRAFQYDLAAFMAAERRR